MAAVSSARKLSEMLEQSWLQAGTIAESLNESVSKLNLDIDLADPIVAYEAALRQNPYCVHALKQVANLCKAREQHSKAIDYFQRLLHIQKENGEIWGALGHCYLMMDELQKAYAAYQEAVRYLPNTKEPKLWYGIGILYDRYGSYEHAEEAFSAVIRMDPKFDKASEIYFRLGIIYKEQRKFEESLECFRYILSNPPKPLTEIDIWYQIGLVYEQQKDYQSARDAYEKVLAENPNHAKVLKQLGWLHHQANGRFENQEQAIQYLLRSLETDRNDAQTYYLLGRCYMQQQKFNKAYEAYQNAVYRDDRNPTFWCSIGVLYYQINQYRDALEAYTRAIRLNPYISEVWYDLGTLYESCNNQIVDAMDAYQRALELDQDNPHIRKRLELLRQAHANGGQMPPPQQLQAQQTTQDGSYSQPVHPNAASHMYQGPSAANPMMQPPKGQQPPPPPPLHHGGSFDNRGPPPQKGRD